MFSKNSGFKLIGIFDKNEATNEYISSDYQKAANSKYYSGSRMAPLKILILKRVRIFCFSTNTPLQTEKVKKTCELFQ